MRHKKDFSFKVSKRNTFKKFKQMISKLKHKGKWKDIKIDKSERNKIYSRLRIKANTILKKKYKKEYNIILRKLLKKEFIIEKNKKQHGR